MTSSRWTAFAALALLLLFSSSARAQGESVSVGQAFGEFFVSGSPDVYDPVVNLEPNVQTPLYLLASVDYTAIGAPGQNAVNGIGAWEVGIDLPAGVFSLGIEYNPDTSLAFGNLQPPNFEFSVGTGSLIPAENGLTVLATITLLTSAELPPSEIVVRPISSPSVPGQVVWVDAEPVGAECFTPSGPITCTRPFAILGGASINPEPVSGEARSFGEVKARF